MDTGKMNVAFMIDAKLKGGGFQYQARAVEILTKREHPEFNFHFYSPKKHVVNELKKSGHDVQHIDKDHLDKIRKLFLRTGIFKRTALNSFLSNCKIERALKMDSIDLVHFLSPSSIAIEMNNIPFSFTVWDLCHRTDNEFPEVRLNQEFDKRERLYNSVLKKAVGITADSQASIDQICKIYSIDRKRVHLLKYLPRPIETRGDANIDIKAKYRLKNNYIYYPAQFWPHKNHIYILKAIKQLKEKHGIEIDAVFSGHDNGSGDHILRKVEEYGITDQIHCIGYIPDEEVPCLYAQATAMVMPTYFGPTNIPPLEAFEYGCPVCYSDLEVLREQVGDAAFLMDLKNPESLCKHLTTILSDKQIVEEKLRLGREILASWTDDDFYNGIIKILENYRHLSQCWK